MRVWVSRLQRAVEGLAPEQAALLLSVGLVLGVFPVMGCPTVLCLFAAAGLRLNWAGLQVLNSLSSPLQFVLLLPLERVGALICGGARLPFGPAAGAIRVAALHAVTGWACVCVPAGALLYFVLISAAQSRAGTRNTPKQECSRTAIPL